MPRDPAILAHQEWLGYVQPTGLVVSIPSLIDASAFLNRNYGPEHQRLLSALPQESDGTPVAEISDFARFAQDVFGWDSELMLGSPGAEPVPPELEVNLENYNETLRPTYALRSLNGEGKWLLLVEVLPSGTDLDQAFAPHDRGWQASPQARFERLLRQTNVPIGLLVNGRQIRLVYAPEKELSGHITFNLADMVKVAGRPIFAALQMLLSAERLYSVADKERLPAILANSRKYQNVVSTQLATQVLEALYELLRGFQAANDQSKGDLLRDVLARDPDHVYHGLLTTLLRLVFVLFAEDRGLLSTDPIYSNYYSITGLYERLRADAGRYPDTMDQRYGAWAQLLALFGLMYSGGSHGAMKIPAREGYLFDPERYLFLEGRHDKKDKPEIPRVSDGVVYRVLTKLLLLDGERLSYRTLAVEQIGSVYEAIMGFELQVATGKSIAIKPAKSHGAPATINLEELLKTAADKRLKWFIETSDQKLTGQAAEGLKSAASVEELLVVLDRKIAKAVTPNVVPQGAMIFQPSNERRKSGSHYTPSSLTGPIVDAALAPVLKQLGDNPKPQQILNLKICDPAMGSGAFLVQACRQLGDELMKAWHSHNEVPVVPLDEDEVLFAQRVVAQRCLYGVDKNPMAVDLAKLSLWLATLAKDHPFTFLDHSLRHGDSLVGLTRQQIAAFHWAPAKQQSILEETIRKRIDRVSQFRRQILEAREETPYATLKQKLDGADESLKLPRQIGDAVIAAFFLGDKPQLREEFRLGIRQNVEAMLKDVTDIAAADAVEECTKRLRQGAKGVIPFHWQLEFPEVFTTDDKGMVIAGFDVIVGNPPFMGGSKLSTAMGKRYTGWLSILHEGTRGKADLVAQFFRRAFVLLRVGGTFGLIATNTIRQGDTRETGLFWIRSNGGVIYRAETRKRWPGVAAVVVSIVHVVKSSEMSWQAILNTRPVDVITAYLFHMGPDGSPATLASNHHLVHSGTNINGKGFVLARELREQFISQDPKCSDRIRPYLGAEEMNEAPDAEPTRFVINMEGLDEEDVKRYPVLYKHLYETVRVQRQGSSEKRLRERWWLYSRPANDLYIACAGMTRVLVSGRAGTHLCFVFQSTHTIFSDALTCFIYDRYPGFTILQSRIHEVWAHFFGSSLKDDPRYIPEACFETFPLPSGYIVDSGLESVGRLYYECRAKLMTGNNEGLTQTYNRLHDPEEEGPLTIKLRELHSEMDRVVLDAYGWTDLRPTCQFIAEFEDEEDESGEESKKTFRYRWADEVRDDVLARLLELNRQRALEEGQVVIDETAGTLGAKAKKPGSGTRIAKKVKKDSTSGLFAMDQEEV
jgi:hypothetical protein